MKTEIKGIVEALEALSEDINVPKNIKGMIEGIINLMKEDVDQRIKINKALHELDEISNDPNLQPYTRTQIWNIVSMLEKF